VPALLRDRVGVLAEQGGGEEPARAAVAARRGRAVGRGEPGLLHSAPSLVARLQDLGRRVTATPHDVQPPAPPCRAEHRDHGGGGLGDIVTEGKAFVTELGYYHQGVAGLRLLVASLVLSGVVWAGTARAEAPPPERVGRVGAVVGGVSRRPAGGEWGDSAIN